MIANVLANGKGRRRPAESREMRDRSTQATSSLTSKPRIGDAGRGRTAIVGKYSRALKLHALVGKRMDDLE
jgi:hypothetical protein